MRTIGTRQERDEADGAAKVALDAGQELYRALRQLPRQRQVMLETVDVETRLRYLICFLIKESESAGSGVA